MTTAGDLECHDGTSATRLPVGTNAQILTVDTGLAGKLKWAAPAGSTVSSPPIIIPSAVDLAGGGGPGYERYLRDLRLRVRPTFEDAVADAKANPPAGRTLANAAGLASSSCAGAVHILTHANAASDWWGGTQTAPMYYDVVDSDEADLWVAARIATDANQNWEYAALIVVDDATPTRWVRINLGEAAGVCRLQIDTSTVASSAGLGGSIATGVWMLLRLTGPYVRAWYSTAAQATPPTSWTWLGGRLWENVDNLPRKLRVGCLVANAANPGGGYETRILYFDHSAWWGDRATGARTRLGGGAGYRTDTPIVQLVTDWDLGSAAPTVSQAALRKIAASIESPNPWDSATWQWSAKQAAAPGAAPTSWGASAALVVDGTGRYFSLWARCTSDGKTAGSLHLGGGVPIPVLAT